MGPPTVSEQVPGGPDSPPGPVGAVALTGHSVAQLSLIIKLRSFPFTILFLIIAIFPQKIRNDFSSNKFKA